MLVWVILCFGFFLQKLPNFTIQEGERGRFWWDISPPSYSPSDLHSWDRANAKWYFYQSNHYLHKTRYGTFIKKIPGQRTKKFRCYQTLNWRRGMSQRFLRMSSFLGILLNVDVDCRFFLVHNSDNNRTSNKKSGFFL